MKSLTDLENNLIYYRPAIAFPEQKLRTLRIVLSLFRKEDRKRHDEAVSIPVPHITESKFLQT